MREMTERERREFLAAGTRTGKLATVRTDGAPHCAPIWFVLDGDDLLFMTWHESIKGRSLQQDRRVALVVDDDAFPYAFVLVEGTVTILTDDATRRLWSERIARRYVPPDLVGQVASRNDQPGELVLRITPTRVVARAAMAE